MSDRAANQSPPCPPEVTLELRREAAGQTSRVRDCALQMQVMDALQLNSHLDGSRIAVAVQDGIVTLYGAVSNCNQKQVAEAAALGVAGVRAIVERVKICYPGEPEPDEDRIARQAVAVVDRECGLLPGSIAITVENGTMVLVGEVCTNHQSRLAEERLSHWPGVTLLLNQLRVRVPT